MRAPGRAYKGGPSPCGFPAPAAPRACARRRSRSPSRRGASARRPPRCPQLPRRPTPQLPFISLVWWRKAGSSILETKIFPGSLCLLIFQFLAAALSAGGGGRAKFKAGERALQAVLAGRPAATETGRGAAPGPPRHVPSVGGGSCHPEGRRVPSGRSAGERRMPGCYGTERGRQIQAPRSGSSRGSCGDPPGHQMLAIRGLEGAGGGGRKGSAGSIQARKA